MKKRTRSILEELNSLGNSRNTELLIENRGANIIESAINLLTLVKQQFNEEDASELERAQYERAKAQMNKSSSYFKDQIEIVASPPVGVEFAIYDNGNVKSENNKFVFKVAQNELLNDEERESLLKAHEAGLLNINNVLENEKKRQE